MFKFARGVQKLICQNFYNYILAQSRRLGAPCNLIFKLISCFFHRKCVFIWFLFSRYRVQFSPKNWRFFGFRICNHVLTTIFSIYRVKIERGGGGNAPPSGVELWRFPLTPRWPGIIRSKIEGISHENFGEFKIPLRILLSEYCNSHDAERNQLSLLFAKLEKLSGYY